MKILALDSSAVTASCALTDNGKLISYAFVNAGLTHSQTLMPLVSQTLSNAGAKLEDIDKIAVSNGPGSFTGVRIGVATVKGISFAGKIPCVGVSTLEAAAYQYGDTNGYICVVMDARRSQVYTATFKSGKKPERLTEDRAIAISQLADELEILDGNIILCGDGAQMCYEKMKDTVPGLTLATEMMRYQSAFGVALAAADKDTVSPQELLPVYLRLPQAERELREKSLN